jgi:hypothetical protein
MGESMDHVIRQMANEGLSPEKISEKTWMPIEYVTMIVQK